MNWRRDLMLICMTVLVSRSTSKLLGDEVLTALVGIGLAIVIGYQIRDYFSSKNAQGQHPSV